MTDDLRQRQQLLKIGTARAGRGVAGAVSLTAPLDTLLPPAEASGPEAALWMSLGALDLWERSGFLPPASPASPAADRAPPEQLRPCPARAEAMLALLLRGDHPPALQSEWLRLLQRHGARLPSHFLPRLLDTATRQPALRVQLLPVLGERGRWLAGAQAEWGWAFGAAAVDEAAWDTGSPEQRLTVLRAWRARDAGAARAALAAAWPGEAPEQRAALLPALAVGLGPGDEAFLEAALDDRRKEVRTAAQRLLASLPGSQLGQRMLARLLPLLQLEKPWLGKAHLELTLPQACDATMRRDGIGAASHPGMGEKAGWVVDMLAAVDPRVWTRQFAPTPLACLALAGHSEFAAVLVRGWSLAALRQAQINGTPELPAWPHDLALWWIGAGQALRDAVPDALFDLVAARFHLDTGGASSALLDALPRKWQDDPALVQLLHRLADKSPDMWTPRLSRHILQRLQAAQPALLLPAFALIVDPATAAGFEVEWRTDAGADRQWRALADQFFDLVRVRHEMILSFQEPA
jgi:hypothetical protein